MYRKHKNTHKTYKHTHISTNILKCIHTHTHCTVYVYKVSISVVECKLLHEGSCVEGLGRGWAIEKWLDRRVVNHPWVSPLMMEWPIRPCWREQVHTVCSWGISCLSSFSVCLCLCLSIPVCHQVSLSVFPHAMHRHSALPYVSPTVQPGDLELTPVKQWVQINPTFPVVHLRYFNTWVGADTYLST